MRFLRSWAVLLLGCGGGDEPTAPVPPGDDPCSDLAASCLENQQACVVEAGVAACRSCGLGEYASAAGCAPIPGTPLSHDFPANSTPPGGEILDLCRSWTLENAEEIWVNAVELDQDESSHHSNWTFVPDTDFDGPDGNWPCDERSYNQLAGALAGGVLYAQSTQAIHEVQKFPNGVAVRIPPYSRIISDVHTLNTTADPVSGHARLTVYGIAEADVTVKLVPFHLTYDGLDIPPQSDARFTGECELEANFQAQAGGPFDLDVYYLLPHTHALGTRMFVHALGGERDGEVLLDVEGFNGEARGRAYDPPVSLLGASGFRFGCEFHNPRDESVGWGFDDQEMCEALGFADATLAFESRVETAEADGEESGIQKFTGPCSSIAFPWDHDKPGGSPP
jgi:hypothetical protein